MRAQRWSVFLAMVIGACSSPPSEDDSSALGSEGGVALDVQSDVYGNFSAECTSLGVDYDVTCDGDAMAFFCVAAPITASFAIPVTAAFPGDYDAIAAGELGVWTQIGSSTLSGMAESAVVDEISIEEGTFGERAAGSFEAEWDIEGAGLRMSGDFDVSCG